MHADYPDDNCDIEDEDDFQSDTTAMLQHYVIVWLSILTSPKGIYYFAILEIGGNLIGIGANFLNKYYFVDT